MVHPIILTRDKDHENVKPMTRTIRKDLYEREPIEGLCLHEQS